MKYEWLDIFKEDGFWAGLAALGLTSILVIFMVAVFSTHDVRHYYTQSMIGSTCVIGQREWVPDVVMVCFQNPNDTIKALGDIKQK